MPSEKTKISWTDSTWNPVTGCTRVSDGCRFCYAEALSLRFGWSKKPWTKPYEQENVILHPERLDQPRRWREPRRIFVNSMSDLFHPLVPDDYIRQVWDVMLDAPQHVYQILTKRPERLEVWPGPYAPHIWVGASVEDWRVMHRADTLSRCRTAVKFLSCEPLIGSLLDPDGDTVNDLGHRLVHCANWVIAGGESGPRYRSMQDEWAREIRDACLLHGIPFFFKQHSGPRPEMDPYLDGVQWHQMPATPVANQVQLTLI